MVYTLILGILAFAACAFLRTCPLVLLNTGREPLELADGERLSVRPCSDMAVSKISLAVERARNSKVAYRHVIPTFDSSG